MDRLTLIADDLTGALDSACAFAARGLSTRVTLTSKALAAALEDPALAVLAHVTATRDGPEDAAAAALSAVAARIAGRPGLLFKKIDSRLKGHVAVELAALRRSDARPVLAAPAVPALGRVVRGGCVCGAGVAVPLPVAPVLGCAATIPDTETADEITAALPADLSGTLFVGAAGLAAALARRLAPSGRAARPWVPSPMLMAVGSRDPITLAQIAAVQDLALVAPNGAVPRLDRVDRLVQLVPGPDALLAPEAAPRLAAGIARELHRLRAPALFACGGETAHAILRALGVAVLDVAGEVLPGVPVARCPHSGLVVVTKSGGFGGPDLLHRLRAEIDSAAAEGRTGL